MLVGKELLDKARSLTNRSEDDIARGCGYVGPTYKIAKTPPTLRKKLPIITIFVLAFYP
jgi:hypothetical protein